MPPGITFSSPSGYGPAVDINSNVVVVMKELAIHMRRLSHSMDETSSPFLDYRRLFEHLRHAFGVGIYNLNDDTVALNAWPDTYTGFGTDGESIRKRFMRGPNGDSFITYMEARITV